MPIIVIQGAFGLVPSILILLPTGSSRGQYRSAASRLIIPTGGASNPSLSVKSRPLRSGTLIVVKYLGVITSRSDNCLSPGNGAGRPSIVNSTLGFGRLLSGVFDAAVTSRTSGKAAIRVITVR